MGFKIAKRSASARRYLTMFDFAIPPASLKSFLQMQRSRLAIVPVRLSKSAVYVDASKRGRLRLVLRACFFWGGLRFALPRAFECEGGLIASQLRQQGGKGAKLRRKLNPNL